MSTMDVDAMQQYLSSSIASLNENKLNGLLAEIEFRSYLARLGLGDRVSVGGWIARTVGGGHTTFGGFTARSRRHNFLRNHTDISALTSPSIEEEFSKEHAPISFQNAYMSEMSDVDGIFWGNQFTYPIEIKEKRVAP